MKGGTGDPMPRPLTRKPCADKRIGVFNMPGRKTLKAVLGALVVSVVCAPALASDGATLYKERACIACHGPEGKVPVMTEYPKLAGQNEQYLLAQMKDIKSGARMNSHSVAMKNIMHMISDEEIPVIAKWLAALEESR